MSETIPPQKPTLGGLLREATVEFSGFESGLPYTVKSLLSAPGATVRRYLDKRDARITRPLRLFVVAMLIYLATASLAGTNEAAGKALQQGLSGYGDTASGLTEFFLRYEKAMFVLVLPLMMFATRIAWPRSNRTLAEHLILNTYLFSMQMLIIVPLTLVGIGLGWAGYDRYAEVLGSIVGPALSIAYAAWLMATFFRGSRVWSALRAIAIQIGMVVIYTAIIWALFVLVVK